MNALTRLKLSCLLVLLCCSVVLVTACKTPQELSSDTTTLEAFSRFEGKLATLRSSDTLEDLISKKILPEPYAVKSLGRVTGGSAAGDGWIKTASGGDLGGLFGTGALTSVSSENVIGSHLFGYLDNKTYVIPKVELQIVGDIISKGEFDTLFAAKKRGNIGFWNAPSGTRINAKNIRVHAVKKLDFPPVPDLKALEDKTTSVKQHFISKLTPTEFERAKSILEKIPPGTDIYGAIRALDGWYFCTKGDGSSCVLWMSGFLNFTDQFRFSVVKTGDALYDVWAFGYLDAEEHEVPKLALILRNGKVRNLVPYTDRASLEAQLRP